LRPDGFDEILCVQTHAFRFYDKPLNFALQNPLSICGRSWRHPGHRGPNSRAYFQPPLVNKVLNHAMRGIGMDLQFGSKRAYGREWLSRQKLAADERFRRSINYLIKDRFAWTQLETKQYHT
jgi:hypothetical protein